MVEDTLPRMTKIRIDNSTGHTGIYRDRKYWIGRIVRKGKTLWQSNFATPQEAMKARTQKLEELGLAPPVVPEPAPIPGACWIPLSQGKFALVDEGDLGLVSTRNWFVSQGYPKTKDYFGVGNRNLTLDRFLLQPPDDREVDHIDHNPFNCRRANLRVATHAENMRNLPKKKSNTSGFIGVSWHKQAGKWAAQASVGKTHVSLGLFDVAEDAARARDAWIRKNHGSFATLNFPVQDPHGGPKK
jgi:hypothetical protein